MIDKKNSYSDRSDGWQRIGRQAGRQVGKQPRRVITLAGAQANRQAIKRTWIPVGIYVITFSSCAWICRSSFLSRRLFTNKTARILSLPLNHSPTFPTSAFVPLLQWQHILPSAHLPPPRPPASAFVIWNKGGGELKICILLFFANSYPQRDKRYPAKAATRAKFVARKSSSVI